MKKYSVTVERIKSLRKDLATEVEWLRSSLKSDIRDVLSKNGFVNSVRPDYPDVMVKPDENFIVSFDYNTSKYVEIKLYVNDGIRSKHNIVLWYFCNKDFDTFYNKKIKPFFV